VNYCKRCVLPENTRPSLLLDERGICSGCTYMELKRQSVDLVEKSRRLKSLLLEYKEISKERGNIYDCIIPISGAKDSHYQAHILTQEFGMHPLYVCFNDLFNTRVGKRNLDSFMSRFPGDLIRITPNPNSVKKIMRYMLVKCGDISWHSHAGIFTSPFQVAVQYNIPLIVYGETGYGESFGMYRPDDMAEFSTWKRQEHDMRGIKPLDVVSDKTCDIDLRDMAPYLFPDDDQIEKVGVRGIYLGNYVEWDQWKNTKLMIDLYNFATLKTPRDRSNNLYTKIDSHVDDVHDYLCFLKFGYGRGTRHSTYDLREGKVTREDAIEIVRKYDRVRPSTLDTYLKFMGITETEFEDAIEHLRDPAIWEKDKSGSWYQLDSVINHINDADVDKYRLPLKDEPYNLKNDNWEYPTEGQLSDKEFILI